MTYYKVSTQMQSIVQLTVIGKVFNPNKGKVLSLNRDLDQYINCIRWYLSFEPTSKQKLHKDAYHKAKERFELKTALLQSARTKQWKSIRPSGR
ncbi:MAG: hypothetical protein GF317_05495 [Candidatus Lokiarchaeota archaeon]|nr:hypothetical protein [Candidatus Lokiarchaeota archaeon]MBD3199261.1 hypothetical protein [Candidatus Lokiarchaeota archaeon]